MIELQNISVTFAKNTPLEHKLFEGLSLQIKTGQFLTIIGGNGAGKSSLMNVISGDRQADSGKIFLDDKEVTKLLPYERAALISRVFQDPLLGTYADLTIEENLSLAYSRGHKRTLQLAITAALRQEFRDLLAHMNLGLENRLKDKMGLLSGGQRQAISLLMATVRPSKILLLDEHTANLDPKMERVILKLTALLVAEKKLTALMITHSMQQALEFGNRTLVMYQGEIVHDLEGEARNMLTPAELLPFF